ncbi:succinyl-diaminopimelate desuccinylase [Caloramator fervidus]|uniref:Succinyl-diaminopimelate desuccinylase n=1 Tax=Caloramator fervidus TaxID=29344 RepID=A0A1H5SXS0_9CLOT|nr:dipeptidase PepV [Caloramator fervidus]SEF55356.1 succinyl-diaminopimelate desuccinylase [Caloramator fervidus]
MDLNQKIDSMREEIIKSTQEILKIKSVEDTPKEGMPFGEGVAKALDYALNLSNQLGFKTVNLDGYVGYAEYGEGEDYIAVLGHLDVVPEGDGWIYPPYGAEIHDGKIYARGALDDKGPIIAALYGLKAIKDLNLPISKRIRIIFGTNEETGSNDIPYYLKYEKPPVAGFTPDAEFPLIHAEKGLTVFNIVKDLQRKPSGDIEIKYIKGGQRANMVPDYCEAGLRVKNKELIENKLKEFNDKGFDLKLEEKDDLLAVKAYGISAHGSTPELGKNAIMILFAFLGELDLPESDIKDFINFMNKYVGFETKGESFGCYLKDETGELSFNVGVIDMNEDKVTVSLNLRYPCTYKLEDMMNPFNKRIEELGIKVEDFSHQEPLYFAKDHELVQKLMKVYREFVNDDSEPLAIGGGTYAKEMPNTLAFGPLFPGKPDVIHKPNEYIEIEDLIMITKIYAKAMLELAK